MGNIKEQICSIEQMKKLKDLGIDTSKASLMYVDFGCNDIRLMVNTVTEPEIPIFTIGDLLDMMPDIVEMNKEKYYLHIKKYGSDFDFLYIDNDGYGIGGLPESSMMDGIFSTFKFLVEEGKIKL